MVTRERCDELPALIADQSIGRVQCERLDGGWTEDEGEVFALRYLYFFGGVYRSTE